MNQLQGTEKLKYVTWVLPTAKENRDAMSLAWYTPTKLRPRPAPRPELEDDEDEDGFLESSEYILKIIDDLISHGIPIDRIVLAGFSQGCAMSLFIGLTSKFAGQFAGVVGLMGYLPLPGRLDDLRKQNAPERDLSKQPALICRGSQDMLVPKRFHQICIDKLASLRVPVEGREHSTGHSISGSVIRDFLDFLTLNLGAL